MHFLDRIYRPANRTVAIGTVFEVRLEDWFQHKLGGGLNHAITNGRYSERSLAAIRFRYVHPPHRIGPVPLRDQFLTQTCQPPVYSRGFDLREGHLIHARRSRIGVGQRIGMTQDIFSAKLVVEHVEAEGRLRLRLTIQLSLKAPDPSRCCQAHHQSPSPRQLRKHTRSQGPSLCRHYPASSVVCPCPTPVDAVAWSDVEAATLALRRVSPDYSNHLFRRAVPTTPADRAGARVDCFPAHAAFPKWQEGRHPHCHFRGLLRLHSRYGPSDCSAALRRPLSRGSSPSGCPAEPLVRYRINRQLSGWNPPPLVIRAFGAHCQQRTFDCTRSNRAWHTQRSVALGYNSGKGSFSSRVVISELKLGNVKRERAPRV